MTLAPFSCKIYVQAFVIGVVRLHAQLQNIFTKMIPQKESSYIWSYKSFLISKGFTLSCFPLKSNILFKKGNKQLWMISVSIFDGNSVRWKYKTG